MKILNSIFLVILFLTTTSFFFNSKKVIKPNAIFFMLHISERKIAALNEMKDYESAKFVAEDDLSINNSIIEDFKNNFNFCPVYFFYSTDFDNVINQKWDLVKFVDNKKPTSNQIQSYFLADITVPHTLHLYDKKFEPLDFILANTNITFREVRPRPRKTEVYGIGALNTKLRNYYRNYKRRAKRLNKNGKLEG